MSPPEAPPTTPTVEVVRPPEGLARGLYAAPAWSLLVLTGTLLLVATAGTVLRARRSKPQDPTP